MFWFCTFLLIVAISGLYEGVLLVIDMCLDREVC